MDPRAARRMANGDKDPSATSKSNATAAGMIPAQPVPGADQKNNVLNNPKNAMSFGPQVGAVSGANEFMYGEQIPQDVQMKMGAMMPAGNSGLRQGDGERRGQNRGTSWLSTPGANLANADNDEVMYHMAQSAGKTRMNAEMIPPSYQIGSMGPTGAPVDMAQPADPSGIPPQVSYMQPNTLPLANQQPASGMNTNRGGGRNKSA